MENNDTVENVREYYGKTLSSNKDLKTNACCTADAIPHHLRDKLANINGEILDKFYGCGSPIPTGLEGRTVLDLGCGTGRDVYLVSQLVGESGNVIGLDMTEEQLSVAKKHLDEQMQIFGYKRTNVEFVQGFIEDLSAVSSESVDVVISNCVINLSPLKQKVFAEIFRVLKPGGELYFSDVFSKQRLPKFIQSNPLLHAECLAGAMYIEDFRRLLRNLNCLDYRVVSTSKIQGKDPAIDKLIENIDFYSMTVRAFKLNTLEDICEDYGQAAIYKGSLPTQPSSFTLDDHHLFLKGKVEPVCGNTASMLSETRFAEHFEIVGDRSTHFGPFDCTKPGAGNEGLAPGACC